jgi:light-regulated signal transduction histidine kinase (bacteriophytochrome)
MSSFSEDDIRRAAEVREWLVKEVTNKKEELDKLRNTLLIVDSLLKKTSFISALNLESPASNLKNKSTQQYHPVRREEEEEEEDTTQQKPKINSVTRSPSNEYRKDDTQGVEIRHLKRAKDNLLISNAEYTPTYVRIALVDDINLNINTPPFKTFFLNRILDGMKMKDREKVQKGELVESEIIDYKVDNDENGKINSVMISNYGESERLNEIFNTATWVFTRMLEKGN